MPQAFLLGKSGTDFTGSMRLRLDSWYTRDTNPEELKMKKAFLILMLGAVILVGCAAPAAQPTPGPTASAPTPSTPSAESKISLPEPILTGQSVEICLNSRYSFHNPAGTASNQQISNVLSAAGKMPITGSFREIYVATPNGTYLYDPADNSLSASAKDVADRGAFVLSWDRDLPFDAGLAYMSAILASVSLRSDSGLTLSNCPMRSKLYFGTNETKGLTSTVVAHCSLPETDAGWLPDPKTTGAASIETVLANLKYNNTFDQTNLTREQISQLLWAGYGCSDHVAAYNRKGLTVPSAGASYYLTGTIYLINEDGVYRYHNRNPEKDLTTRDHRLERIGSSDVRNNLRSAVSGLSQAPCYVILCLNSAASKFEYAQLEAGFVAGNMLMQATAMDMGCYFNTQLTEAEQQAIQAATGIPAGHIPQAVVSLGIPQAQ
jgi:hypothetical protein